MAGVMWPTLYANLIGRHVVLGLCAEQVGTLVGGSWHMCPDGVLNSDGRNLNFKMLCVSY